MDTGYTMRRRASYVRAFVQRRTLVSARSGSGGRPAQPEVRS